MRYIAESKLNPNTLLGMFQANALEAELHVDDNVYVSSGIEWPCWINIDSERSLLNIFTYADLKDFCLEFPLWLVNDLNGRVVLPAFWANCTSLHATYFLPTNQKISSVHLHAVLRRFSGAFRYALNESEKALRSHDGPPTLPN